MSAKNRGVLSGIDYYMNLPYRIELIRDEDGWFASIPELPGCISQGVTAEEAVEMIRDAQRLWLQVALEDGDPIPEPHADEHSYSGKFNVRVPKDLHRWLAQEAERDGVSLNQLVVSILSRARGTREVKQHSPGVTKLA
jgi:antitoxin HicB